MLAPIIDTFVSLASPRLLSRAARVIPPSFLSAKNEESFRRVVRYVYKHSKFYRRKFDELGIDPRRIRGPKDLGDFYTLPEDIVNHAEEFLCKTPQIVFESSGTTGRNKRVYFTQCELDDIGKINAMGFFLWGLKSTDRIVNAFDFCIWIPGIVTQKGIEKSGIFSMAAGKVDPVEVYKRIPVHNFNVVIGEPTWLIKLTEIAEKNGAYPLKFLIGAAETMPAAARPWMEKVWPGVQIRMIYASVESGGVIGSELSSVCGGYHIDENDFLVEIADPDHEGYGEVTFTTLTRTAMPLVRYRNRDISRIIEEKCPCGVKFRRLAPTRGRADEMVIAAAGNLYPLMFQEILKDVKGLATDWQVIFRLHGLKETMEFNLELADESISKDAIKEKVLSNIHLLYPDIWKNLSIGIFYIDFVYHKPGTLRVNRKLIRLLDKRYVP
ncbi:MAG: hypothetical protein WC515_06045 [Candidatus Omnitrophota bacterium]